MAGAGNTPAEDEGEQCSQMEREGIKRGFTFCINNPPPQPLYPSQKVGLIESKEKAQTQVPRLIPTNLTLPPLLEDETRHCLEASRSLWPVLAHCRHLKIQVLQVCKKEYEPATALKRLEGRKS